jgi:hypothetical protein
LKTRVLVERGIDGIGDLPLIGGFLVVRFARLRRTEIDYFVRRLVDQQKCSCRYASSFSRCSIPVAWQGPQDAGGGVRCRPWPNPELLPRSTEFSGCYVGLRDARRGPDAECRPQNR